MNQVLALVLGPALLDSKPNLLKSFCSIAFLVMIKIRPVFKWWYSMRDGRPCLRTYWFTGSWGWNLSLLVKSVLYKCKSISRWDQLFLGKCVPEEVFSTNHRVKLTAFLSSPMVLLELVFDFLKEDVNKTNSRVYTDLQGQLKEPLLSLKHALIGCKISSSLNSVIWEIPAVALPSSHYLLCCCSTLESQSSYLKYITIYSLILQ